MKFYDLEGKPLTNEEFVNYYCVEYFLPKKGYTPFVKGLRRSSSFVEKQICEILRNGINDGKDVIKILAWKIGKIKHADSERERSIIYSKDWENAEKSFNILRFKKPVDLSSFVGYIADNYGDLHNRSLEKPQSVLNELRECAPFGIGTVYLLTLLFFISNGKHPIYDRFALKALIAANNGFLPYNENIGNYELPDKNSDDFKTLLEHENIKKYKALLHDAFGDKYKTSRNIDRALWVYGHLFNK